MPEDSFGRLRQLQAEVTSVMTDSPDAAVDQVPEQERMRRFIRFWALVARDFIRNRCLVRASALAYTTLIALVPMLAVAVGVTTSLLQSKGEAPIRKLIEQGIAYVAPMLDVEAKEAGVKATENRETVVKAISNTLANIHSGAINATGAVMLLFVAIGLLRNIEQALNDIWGVSRGRGWKASITVYFTTIALGPLLAVVAIGLTGGSQGQTAQDLIRKLPLIGGFVFKLLPLFAIILALALLYGLMPNTRVSIPAAFAGAAMAGGLLQLNNWLSVLYVSNVVSNNRIYGSLGILPLLLFGLYLSWAILLFGAQVAYTFQNRLSYLQDRQSERVHQQGREFVALRFMTEVGRRFAGGEKPATATALANSLGVPARLAAQVLTGLVQAKLLVEVAGTETAYSPSRPLDQITARDILRGLRAGHGRDIATHADGVRDVVRTEFDAIAASEDQRASATTLGNLVERAAKSAPRPAVL